MALRVVEMITRTMKIKKLGHRGDGIANDGTLVAGGLPGEIVEGEVQNGRVKAPRILVPAPERVKPVCRHSRRCGGCHVQHASDDFVDAWKSDIVRTAMLAHDLDAPLRHFSRSPPGSRRRASLSGHRSRSTNTVGFYARSGTEIISVPDCKVLVPRIVAVLPFLEFLTPFASSRRGTAKYAVLDTIAGVDICVTDAKAFDPLDAPYLVAQAEQHGVARLEWNRERMFQFDIPQVEIASTLISPPAGAFLQATTEGEKSLQDAVSEAVDGAKHIVDLFSGLGTFSLPLSKMADVHAVEGDARLLEALDFGWRHSIGLKAISVEKRDLFRHPLEPDELNRFDGVVIDPPRTGSKEQVERLALSGPGRVAMVSCNPVTFARDCRILFESGYRIEWIDIIDQFRWSTHVEVVAALVR